MDFKLDAVRVEMDKVKQAEARLQEGLRQQLEASRGVDEQLDEKLSTQREELVALWSKQREAEEARSARQAEDASAAVDAVRRELADQIAELSTGFDTRVISELKDVRDKLSKVAGQVQFFLTHDEDDCPHC